MYYISFGKLSQKIMKTNMILILGVTASGKGKLAFDLAENIGAEIISIDSMKVYRRMDIGTGKPSKHIQQQIKYHLIDIVEPSQSFSVGSFLQTANNTIENIRKRNKPVIAVGGTALYIKALLYGMFEGPAKNEGIRKILKAQADSQGLQKLHQQLTNIDPDAALRIHPNDRKRIIRALEVYQITGKPISSFQQQFNSEPIQKKWTIIGLRREKTNAANRINSRVKKMIEQGLVDEVKSLLAEDNPLSKQAKCAIGYAEIIEYLNNEKVQLDDAVELIKKNTRRLAKNQRTWFKTFKNVNWLDIEPDDTHEKILDHAKALLNDID